MAAKGQIRKIGNRKKKVSESKVKDRVNKCCHGQDQARLAGLEPVEKMVYIPDIQPIAVTLI
jgi:hypothetical protein